MKDDLVQCIPSALETIKEKLLEQSHSRLRTIGKRFLIQEAATMDLEDLLSEIMKSVNDLLHNKYHPSGQAEMKTTVSRLLEGLINEEIETISYDSVEELDQPEIIEHSKMKPSSIKLNNMKRCICDLSNLSLKDMLVRCSRPLCDNKFHPKCLNWKRDKSKPTICPRCVITTNDPLHKMMKIIIEPSILVDSEIYSFNLAYDDYNTINKQKNIGIEIRSLKLDGKGNYEQTLPDSGTLRFNNSIVKEFKPLHQNSSLKKRKDEKFFSRHNIKLGNNHLKIQYENVKDGKNSERTSDPKYIFCVLLVKKLTVDELAEQIKHENVLSKEESISVIKEKFITQGDLSISEIKVDLKCKITLTILEDPARGIHCTHIDCFNLRDFLKSMENNKTRKWVCPLCRKWCSEVIIDSYLAEIVREAKSQGGNSDKAIIYSDGTFKLGEEQGGKHEHRNAQHPDQNAIEFPHCKLQMGDEYPEALSLDSDSKYAIINFEGKTTMMSQFK